jgi:hypothetical protein
VDQRVSCLFPRLSDCLGVPGVTLVRPFVNILPKEIAFYLHLKRLNLISRSTPRRKTRDIASVTQGSVYFIFILAHTLRHRIPIYTILDFVASLDASFPSTVSTISRTTAKLGLRSDRDRNVDRCPLCGLYVFSLNLQIEQCN